MASRKTVSLEDQIRSLETVVAGYKSQLEESHNELVGVQRSLDEERAARRENRDIAERWKKRSEELTTEVGNLREELHGLTIEKARLEGYIDRARETETTEAEPVMVTVPLDQLQPRISGRHGSSMDYLRQQYGSSGQVQPWYKRDV